MGHSAHAAYLMHISLLSTRWRHFSHNCLQLKVNTHTKQKKLPKLLYKTQECNASGVLLSVNTESPFYNFFFFVFFRQSCTVTALSSNMHLVLSHRCVQTIWSVWKPPGLMLNRKGQWICPLSGFRVKSLSFLGVDRFPFTCPTRLPLSRNSICLSPWKAATGSAGKLEAAFHCSPNPDPTQLQRELWCSRHLGFLLRRVANTTH